MGAGAPTSSGRVGGVSPRAFVDACPDAFERRPPGFVVLRRHFRNCLDAGLQCVHIRVRVAPRVAEHVVVERFDESLEPVDREHVGAGRHQEADGELDCGDALHQAELDQPFEQGPVALDGGPRGEGHERRGEMETGRSRDRHRPFEVLRGVAFRESGEDCVVDRLDGGDEEQAARLRHRLDVAGVADDVLDLHGRIERDLRERFVQGTDHPQRVGGAVEKVRVAERDVPGSRCHLLRDVGDDHVHRNDAEPPLVDGHHRTVAAPVLAPARSLGESGGPGRAVGHHQAGVALERGQGVPQRGAKRDPGGVVDHSEPRMRLSGPHALGEREEMRLVLAADDGVHSVPAQHPRVDRCVQPVCAQRCARGEGANLREHFERESGRGVHRQVDRDHARGAERIGRQTLDREVAAADVEPGVVEPAPPAVRGQTAGAPARRG